MNVITLRDYAKQNNVSYEAVRKQVVRYAAELGDHIIKDGRQQFLDEEAVAFLDGKRQKNPVAIIQMDKDETIDALRREKEDLLQKIAIQADKISELSAWKADNVLAIAEANQRQLLLEEKTEQIEVLEAQNRDLSDEKDFYMQKGAEALEKAQKASDELTEAKAELEKRNATEKELAERTVRAENENNELKQRLEDYQAELNAYAQLPAWKRLFVKPPVQEKE